MTVHAHSHIGIDRRNGSLDRRRPCDFPTTTLRIVPKNEIDDEQHVTCIGEFGDVDGLVVALLQHDPYTRMHVLHVNRLAAAWLEVLGWDSHTARTFLQAALLHDAGKIVVREEIILAPRSLTPEEYAEVKRHVEFGVRLLTPYPRLRRVRNVVAQHHEWFDGTGYPHGLAGDALDTVSRALSVLDAFSAMTIDRPYHRGISDEQALMELERCAGTQFDPQFVESFTAFRRSALGRGVA